ncbi:alpha/beta fold hydrolase [Paenibacillus alkalitolerans]|uniref:alpha/beta fold hydrolase n=1 Tax=Paenibacillus alkalitolerans TaxID=2799335 RepID=UPI0018F4F455|nr:alpha/beta hydrolase [Paenibacillus alkalitolerans]
MALKQLRMKDGIELEVYDEGSGAALLFLHGFPLHKGMWEPQFTEFKSTRRVVAPDLRGFGGSRNSSAVGPGRMPEPVTMAQFADDAAELLDKLGIDKAVVIGFSMGGYIAFELMKRHRERVAGLVLADTRAGADTEEGRAGRRKMAAAAMERGPVVAVEAMLTKLLSPKTPDERPELAAAVERMMLDASGAGIAAAALGMAGRSDMTELLPDIQVPALVIVGEDDAITPPETARSMAEAIPDAAYAVIAGGGHLANMERPAEFNRVLSDWLREISK